MPTIAATHASLGWGRTRSRGGRITKADFKLTQNRQKANRLGATTDSENSSSSHTWKESFLATPRLGRRQWPVEICVTEPRVAKNPGERTSAIQMPGKSQSGSRLKDTLVGITKPHKRLACSAAAPAAAVAPAGAAQRR